jgi:predicted regulator of Ras-like GTPase activity (Roadblock/LC7/MglB family)
MLSSLVNGFTQRVAGVAHAVVASPDGLLIAASDSLPADRAEQLAAMTSGVLSVSLGAARLLDGDDVRQTMVEMARGYLVVAAISPGVVLAVLIARGSEISEIGFEMARLAQEVTDLIVPAGHRVA